MLHIPSSADTDFKGNGVSVAPAGAGTRGGIISGAIVKENMRRFWPIGLVALLVNIAVGVIPFEYAGYYDPDTGITELSSSAMMTFGFIGIIFAIIASVAVFRYMHSPSALAVVHTFPVKKTSLYFSNLLSGLILALAPFILCSLYIWGVYGSTGTPELILVVCVIILFTYAVSALAGMVSGNTPVHIISALTFNFVWMLLYYLTVIHITAGFYGLDFSDKSLSASYLHPFSYFMNGSASDFYTMLGIIMYFLISVMLFAVAYFLYRSFKAERAGESITFRPVEYIFIYILTFGGMFIGEFLLNSFDETNIDGQTVDPMTYVSPYLIAGAVIGAVVAFVVALMIVKKSARVFNLAALRRFGIFAVAAVIFMVCTLTNITGIETRVPEATEMKSGALYAYNSLLPPYKSRFSGIYDGGYIPIRGESDMQALANFHRNALDEKAYIYDSYTDEVDSYYEDEESGGSNQTVSFAYGLKNSSEEFRSYTLSGKYLTGSELYAKLMASESVKDYLSIKNLIGYENIGMPEIFYGGMYGEQSATPDTDVRSKLTASALSELAVCLDEDYIAMSASDMMNPGKSLFTLNILSGRPAGRYYDGYNSALSGSGESIYKSLKEFNEIFGMKYTVTEKSVKTIAWLKDKGIYDSIVKTAKNLKSEYDKNVKEDRVPY